MLELTLVRHGTTELNQRRCYQGHLDAPLSERGRAEAARLGARLRGLVFDHILCSDLLRCRQTLELALPGATAEADARWRELHFGAWEGLTWDQCRARDPELLDAWTADPTRAAPPGGESWEAFRARVDAVTDALPTSGGALLVAHGGTIRRVVARALGLEWRQVVLMELSPCGLTRLALHPEGGHLRSWNCTG